MNDEQLNALIDQWGSSRGNITDLARKVWEAATAAEREACAKLCEAEKDGWTPRLTDEDIAEAGKQAADNCAAAIRAR